MSPNIKNKRQIGLSTILNNKLWSVSENWVDKPFSKIQTAGVTYLCHQKIYHGFFSFLLLSYCCTYTILLQFLPSKKMAFSVVFLWFICWHMIATGCRASLCLLTRCGRRWHRCCVLDTICDPSPDSNIWHSSDTQSFRSELEDRYSYI